MCLEVSLDKVGERKRIVVPRTLENQEEQVGVGGGGRGGGNVTVDSDSKVIFLRRINF